MNWFLHNAIADLYGPYFLLFYFLAIVAMIWAARRSIRSVDHSLDRGLPEVPANLDPYEVAYLRGGENEVTRVAIASMIQRGLLRIVEKRVVFTRVRQVARARDHQRGELRSIESIVWGWPGFPAEPRKLFQSGGLASHVGRKCAGYESDLADRDFLVPDEEMESLALRVWIFGASAIILLGGYKLVVAHMKGHSNVGFLWFLMLFGFVIYTFACWIHPRISLRGKAYLQRLQQVFDGLGDRLDRHGEWTTDPNATGQAGPECLLLLGIFGITALAHTPLDGLRTIFRGSSVSMGFCGAGCGGGGCGGGGCGGGGCGGGCGGCGG